MHENWVKTFVNCEWNDWCGRFFNFKNFFLSVVTVSLWLLFNTLQKSYRPKHIPHIVHNLWGENGKSHTGIAILHLMHWHFEIHYIVNDRRFHFKTKKFKFNQKKLQWYWRTFFEIFIFITLKWILFFNKEENVHRIDDS